MLFKAHSKKIILSTFIALGAALLFIANPIFAQIPPATNNTPGQNGESALSNDFDNDVEQGKNELDKDLTAKRSQEEVLDGEDEIAGDEEDNDINEHATIQEAENAQGKNEENEDVNNSGIDEVDDANNLDEGSQEVMSEHQAQEEGGVENEQQSERANPENRISNQEGSFSEETDQPEASNSNQ